MNSSLQSERLLFDLLFILDQCPTVYRRKVWGDCSKLVDISFCKRYDILNNIAIHSVLYIFMFQKFVLLGNLFFTVNENTKKMQMRISNRNV